MNSTRQHPLFVLSKTCQKLFSVSLALVFPRSGIESAPARDRRRPIGILPPPSWVLGPIKGPTALSEPCSTIGHDQKMEPAYTAFTLPRPIG